MQLPEKFKFLETIGPLPKMVAAGIDHLGLKEVPGKKNNPHIMNMAMELGLTEIYTNDDTSWCALFQCFICKTTGKPLPDKKGDIYNLLRAKSFSWWGNPVAAGDERLGDILVFKRPGGGHVGMYIAESDNSFFVLGGNQSNAVTITEIAKSRMIACRRYYAVAAPASAQKYKLTSSGMLSKNEA